MDQGEGRPLRHRLLRGGGQPSRRRPRHRCAAPPAPKPARRAPDAAATATRCGARCRRRSSSFRRAPPPPLAVLALSRLTFEGRDGESGDREALLKDDDGSLAATAARCLSVKPEALADSLISRHTYLATGDSYVKPLDENQAADATDALGKAVYGRNFNWLVSRINALIDPKGSGTAHTNAAGGFIGILDIFGFESFKVNSFEQLCINYANEVLQNQFNADVFRQQQREYEAEGVPWQHVDYQDNAAMLEMLGAKGAKGGAFSLLDEECRLQTGTAAAFVEKFSRANPNKELLTVPALQKRDTAPSFTITHYAGKVARAAVSTARVLSSGPPSACHGWGLLSMTIALRLVLLTTTSHL